MTDPDPLYSRGKPMEYLLKVLFATDRKMNAKRIKLDGNPFVCDINNLVNGFFSCVDMIIM